MYGFGAGNLIRPAHFLVSHLECVSEHFKLKVSSGSVAGWTDELTDGGQVQEERPMSELKCGFVYVLTNDAMPDLVKIGRSIDHPAYRAKELSQSDGIPAPFRLVAFWTCEDAATGEKKAGDHLAERYEAGNRDFFKLDVETTLGEVEQALSTPPTWIDDSLKSKELESASENSPRVGRAGETERLLAIQAHELTQTALTRFWETGSSRLWEKHPDLVQAMKRLRERCEQEDLMGIYQRAKRLMNRIFFNAYSTPIAPHSSLYKAPVGAPALAVQRFNSGEASAEKLMWGTDHR